MLGLSGTAGCIGEELCVQEVLVWPDVIFLQVVGNAFYSLPITFVSKWPCKCSVGDNVRTNALLLHSLEDFHCTLCIACLPTSINDAAVQHDIISTHLFCLSQPLLSHGMITHLRTCIDDGTVAVGIWRDTTFHHAVVPMLCSFRI